MTIRKFLGVFLSFAIAMPAGATTTSTGTVRGIVSMSGRNIEGLSLTLVNVETGKSFAVRTAADGSFTAALPAGSYVFSSPGRAGISISRAPLSVDVFSGKVASANVEMASLSVQGQPTPTGSATITHDAANCITEGEFTLIEAIFEPLSSVVNGRLYFQSNLSPEWFYTEFEKIEPAVPGGPTHRAFIPKVNKDGGIEKIIYYIQVTSSDFAETKSPENTVTVVAGATDCQGKLAPIGTPDGAVSVLSASGSAAGGLAGFGGIAGAGLGVAAIVGIVGGVILGGAAIKVSQKDPTPTPTPTATPTVTPPPVVVSPTPVPLCTLSVVTSPNTFGGDWGPKGSGPDTDPVQFSSQPKYCEATVLVDGALFADPANPVSGPAEFRIRCNALIRIEARVSPVTSLIGPKPASWTGDCSGSVLGGAPCVLQPSTQVVTRNVGLSCTPR